MRMLTKTFHSLLSNINQIRGCHYVIKVALFARISFYIGLSSDSIKKRTFYWIKLMYLNEEFLVIITYIIYSNPEMFW